MNKVMLFAFLISVCACKEISFEKPQPEGRKALSGVPKSLQGKYLAITENGSPSKDTIIVTPQGYYFGYFDAAERAARNDEYDKGVLSDSMVLKYYKGYYFLNRKEDPEWILRVIKQEKNGDLQYMTMEEKDLEFKDYLKKLSLEIKIDSTVTPEKTLYQIRPTPSELLTLIRKGYFSSSRLVKVKPDR